MNYHAAYLICVWGKFGESSKCISCRISISGYKLMESGVQHFVYDFILFSSGCIKEGGDFNKIVFIITDEIVFCFFYFISSIKLNQKLNMNLNLLRFFTNHIL